MTPADFETVLAKVIALRGVVEDSRDLCAGYILKQGHSRHVKRMVATLYKRKRELRDFA